ncbi:MFS transporter [Flavimobilis soli]|uniref:MFS transporter n=1 Tax=Flavimobilis soli TaxID=442709 RepID=A0A2A9EAT0_9MICO|nr:MFS transporter [Flavimobilis soli]PFG36177.1 MFS transporter [Flavimobilis soli]
MTTDPSSPDQTSPTAGSRVLVVGMVALITVGAFEALAVSTAMPTIAKALDGLGLYAAAFSLTLATSVVGMVVSGALADRTRPVQPLLIGVGSFALGLLAAGLATSMTVLLVGRALQGLGSGMFVVALYVIVARAFPAEQRAKVLAAFSAAWVVPSLVGPMIAGFIVQTFGWRWVFLAVVVIAVPAAIIIVTTTWRVPAPDAAADGGATGPLPWRRFGLATLAGAGVAAMSLGAATDGAERIALVAGGAALATAAGAPLLPRGTFRAARGLPTVVALRGIVAAAFFASEVFLPLILQTERHMTPASAGTILTVGAVTWATGSAVRGRSHWSPTTYLRLGSSLIAVAIVAVATLTLPASPTAIAWVGWACGGFGIGMIYPTLAVLVFDLSEPHEQGSNTSALQVSDALMSAFVLALSGTAVTALVAQVGVGGYAVGFGATLLLALLAVAISPRVVRAPAAR